MENSLGLYVHIPFCRSKCDYCDFYSLAGQDDRMDGYQRALLQQILDTAPRTKKQVVNSVYIGGGTPTWYGEKRLLELISALKKRFNLSKDVEFTLEANPDSVDEKMLRRLRRAGVNRLSMGMQSACDRELAAVHRPHTFKQVEQAVKAARNAKIKNLNLDLIYGLPGQTEESWRASVEAALALEPEHLSCYGLKVEEGTPLAARAAAGEPLPDDDAQADMYLWMVERLAQAGYEQYEISNFAKPGFASRHNLRYWQLRPYIGFGPAAHSDFGGRRYSWVRDLEGYIAGVLEGGALLDSQDLIPEEERGCEYLMLGLRTVRGIEEWEYRSRYFMDFAPIEARLEELQPQGWTEKTAEGRWRFTPWGFLVSNVLISDLLERQEKVRLDALLPRAQARYQGNRQDAAQAGPQRVLQ